MVNRKKIGYVVLYGAYASPFLHLMPFETITYDNFSIKKQVLPSLIVFAGGADLDSSLYGDKTVYVDDDSFYAGMWYDTKRDSLEVAVFKWAQENKIPMFGTCRGLQLLTSLTGGKLIQDMRHPYYHDVYTENTCFQVNSMHHQMCVPTEDQKVLAWARGISPSYRAAEKTLGLYKSKFSLDTFNLEPEAIAFPAIRSLGVQWHPEALPLTCQANVQLMKWVKEHMLCE